MKKLLQLYPFDLAFSILFVVLATLLNLQFLIGSNINTTIAGHDEYIAVKEIYSILAPASAKHWLMAVISGNALYYGRVMFYFDALVAAIPFWMFGIKGMVFTVRMLHALIILSSLLLLANTFLEKTYQKVLFLIGSTCIYYSMYFIMMPKPEPHQLLCLSWFLNRSIKHQWGFGRHYIFLGLAYGLKFNMLLLLPVFFIVPVLKHGSFDFKALIWPGLRAFAYLILGIIIAIPCLILTPVKPIFLKTYLHETFGGTEKTYDNLSLGFLDWMYQGLGGSYLGYGLLAFPFLAFIVYHLMHSLSKAGKTKNLNSSVLLISGFILTMVIMLKTKRLWPHYLWTGYILMLLGSLVSIEDLKAGFFKRINSIIISVFVGISFFFFVYRELPLYTQLNQQKEIVKVQSWSLQAIEYLKSKNTSAKVATDGTVLYPFEDFVKVDLYHPFSGKISDVSRMRFYWYSDHPEKVYNDSNDFIVFYKRHPERMLKEHPNVYNGRHEELYQLYQSNINKTYIQDTTFGELIIYKQIKK